MTENTSGAGSPPQSDLEKELIRLGEQLNTALKTAWESEDRKRLQSEVSTGLRTLADRLEQTIETAKTSPKTAEIKAQAEKVWQEAQAQGPEIVDNLRDGLVKGLQGLNAGLARLIEHLEKRDGGPTPGQG